MKILLIFTLCLIPAEFSVMIRELTVEDTGTYQCGIDLPREIDIYTPVELKVKEDLSYEKSISKTVHVGGDLNVSCKYPESFRSDPKFLCKTRLQRAACSYKVSVKESRKDVNEGKFSLYDDRETQMFTVSIRNVTEQDSGEYWCGAEAAWTSDDGYKVYFTQIDLTVTDPRVPVSASIPTQPSSSLSSSSSPPPPSSSSSSSSSSSLSSELNPASPPAGFPVSTVITVSVILLLLLIGIIFLFVILHKKCRIQAGTTSIGESSVQGSGNDQEEVKYTRRLSASDAGTVYCNVQLATIPSGPTQNVYANVYSTPQLPTIPPDQEIYSTAQLPTSLSDSSASADQQLVGESAEGLNYAAATGSNAVPKMTFKKQEISYVYDTVSHVNSCG
ncbi:CMRF35-like molecule 8 [Ictalurus punctatus]|uniref:CMRF35-like molecule 8 n=1 Tax=Ictalurus punctatus TaxID=7998 RepID=A0A9F7RF70_ICTPU|nr:CMRF35-like molecule 8 [Ictalurus punctatus]